MMKLETEAECRLPVGHPDYRYPASRNPYWSKLAEMKGRVYSDHETEEFVGQWRDRFLDRDSLLHRELQVEIGCNGGHVLLEWASRNPATAYIGIDWKFKPIFRGAEKALQRGLKNALFFRAHAERLRYLFAPGEVDRLCVFFPDPWPRKKQWKNRFVTASMLQDAARILKPGGTLWIKTDHPGYYEWMVEALEQTKDLWNILENTRDLHRNHPDPKSLRIPDITLFEGIFIREGISIHSIRLQNKS